MGVLDNKFRRLSHDYQDRRPVLGSPWHTSGLSALMLECLQPTLRALRCASRLV